MNKPLKPDRVLAELKMRLARWIPLRARIVCVSMARRPPRALILLLAFTACALVAAHWGIAAARLLSDMQAAANGAWALGQYANAARCEIGVVGVLLLATMAGLLGSYGNAGRKYVLAPSIGERRHLRRLHTWALICGVSSCAMIPVGALAGTFADDELRRSQEGYHAIALAFRLRPATAARILADEDAGRWYATPQDGPASLDVKRELKEGPLGLRRDLRTVLVDIQRARGFRGRAPLE
jgi:hypothetical protein